MEIVDVNPPSASPSRRPTPSVLAEAYRTNLSKIQYTKQERYQYYNDINISTAANREQFLLDLYKGSVNRRQKIYPVQEINRMELSKRSKK